MAVEQRAFLIDVHGYYQTRPGLTSLRKHVLLPRCPLCRAVLCCFRNPSLFCAIVPQSSNDLHIGSRTCCSDTCNSYLITYAPCHSKLYGSATSLSCHVTMSQCRNVTMSQCQGVRLRDEPTEASSARLNSWRHIACWRMFFGELDARVWASTVEKIQGTFWVKGGKVQICNYWQSTRPVLLPCSMPKG